MSKQKSYKEVLASIIYLQESLKAGTVPEGFVSLSAAKVEYMYLKRIVGRLKKKDEEENGKKS